LEYHKLLNNLVSTIQTLYPNSKPKIFTATELSHVLPKEVHESEDWMREESWFFTGIENEDGLEIKHHYARLVGVPDVELWTFGLTADEAVKRLGSDVQQLFQNPVLVC